MHVSSGETFEQSAALTNVLAESSETNNIAWATVFVDQPPSRRRRPRLATLTVWDALGQSDNVSLGV